MEITLTEASVTNAYNFAQHSFARWANRSGHYNNRLRSHFVGKLGEIATEILLVEAGFQLISHFRNKGEEGMCDITVTSAIGQNTRIEVKSWTSNFWNRFGRCIAVDQVSTLQRKCDLIVWCVVAAPIPIVDTPSKTAVIVKVGQWSSLSDVLNAPKRWTGPENKRQVHNCQIDANKLREWNTLVLRLRGEEL